MTEATPLSQNLGRVQRMAFRVGIAALAVLLLGLLVDTDKGAYRFFQAYLLGFLFWLAPTLGSLDPKAPATYLDEGAAAQPSPPASDRRTGNPTQRRPSSSF